MRNVSVSVHNFTRPSLRDRCWKGRVEGKITSIAFFHAWFANFSLPFQLYRLLPWYNALVNPHFDYYSGMGIFLRVARPQEYEYFETYDIVLHQSAFWSEPADQKSFLFKPRWFKFRSRGMRVRKKMRFQQCGIRMDWVWEPSLQNLKNRVTRSITFQK